MTGARTRPPDDAGEGAFHAGDDDEDAGGVEAGSGFEQAMEAGDADVEQAVDVVAQRLG